MAFGEWIVALLAAYGVWCLVEKAERAARYLARRWIEK